jgi:hypothetical protein
MAVTYDVRVWRVERIEGKTRSSYKVRWVAEGRLHRRTLPTALLADSFRSDLLTATRRGEAFDTETGLPFSLAHQ